MTVSSTVRRAGPFAGNGATTSFPFTFKVFAKSDLEVTHTDTSTGVETVLVLDADYTVSLNADQDANPGGTITYPASGSPLPATGTLVAVGGLAYEQSLDLTNTSRFLPQAIEDAMDKQAILSQQLLERDERTLKFPVSDGEPDSDVMPAIAARSGKYFAFDADGNPTASAGTGNDAALRTDLAASGGSALSGFLQAGVGAVAQTAQAQLRILVCPDNYGAVGDGVADDTAAVQKAINYAAANKGTVSFPNLYACSSALTLSIKAGVKFQGNGSSHNGSAQRTGLLYTGAGAGTFLDVSACESIQFSDLRIAYNNGAFTGTLVALPTSARVSLHASALQGDGVASALYLLDTNTAIGCTAVACTFSGAQYLIRGQHENTLGFSNGNAFIGCDYDSYSVAAFRNPGQAFNILGGFCENRIDTGGKLVAMDVGVATMGLSITGVWMGDASLAAPFSWIQIAGGTGVAITGNYCNGTGALLASAVEFTGATSGVTITGNRFSSLNEGVALGAGLVSDFFIHSNAHVSVNAPVTGTPAAGANGILVNANASTGETRQKIYGGVAGGFQLQELSPAFGANVAIDCDVANSFQILVSSNIGFTIAAPTNPKAGQTIDIVVRNGSGGAMGVITWGATYRMAAWVNPADTFSRTISFRYNGAVWVEKFRTPADVPN